MRKFNLECDKKFKYLKKLLEMYIWRKNNKPTLQQIIVLKCNWCQPINNNIQ